jgi:hypothetical protein
MSVLEGTIQGGVRKDNAHCSSGRGTTAAALKRDRVGEVDCLGEV